MQLKLELQTMKKGDLSMTDYLQKAKILFDNLIAVSQHVSDSDLIGHILNGLGSEYDPFVFALHARPEEFDLTLDNLHGLLISHELRLLQSQPASDGSSPQANMASKETASSHAFDSMPTCDNRAHGRGRGRGRG